MFYLYMLLISDQDTSPVTDWKLCMCLEQALTVAVMLAVGCFVGKLGGFPSETHISCKLAEMDLEVPSACEFNSGFSLRSKCK